MASWRVNPRMMCGLPLSALVAGTVVAAAACSGGGGSPPAPQPAAGAATPHAIHVFIKHPDGSRRQVDFGPGTELTFTGGGGSGAGSVLSRPLGRIRPMVVDASAEDAGGGSPVTAPPTIADPGSDVQATAWMLVARAAMACGLSADPTFGPGSSLNVPPWGPAVPGSSSLGNAWYIYTIGVAPYIFGLPDNCSERLFLEQNLVCVADQLAGIADAVGDVVWPAYPGLGGQAPPYQYGEGDASDSQADFSLEWDIPPQSDADRFIVRDLAIHTLGMIPVMDAYTDLYNNQSCSTSFAQVASSSLSLYPVTAARQPAIYDIFGFALPVSSPGNTPRVPYFPPSSVPYVIDATGTNNLPRIAQTALDINAQILRSSGRLLHDLIRRDVYSDLAAAAQHSGQALDPVSGNAAAWGAQGGASLYGTIAHAARVLLGRWEIGDVNAVRADGGPAIIPPSVSDPQCEGTTELGLLPGAFGTDYAPRYLDRQIRTPGEQTAAELVERSGIVIPSCMIPSAQTGGGSGSAAGLKQALIGQLLLQEQVQNDLPSPPPAAALTQVVNGLSDSDVVFAFQRALYTWELLTNTVDPSAPGGAPDGGAQSCAGLQTSPLFVPTGGLPAGLTSATYPPSWPGRGGQPLIFDTCPASSSNCATVASLLGVVVNGGLSRSRLATDPIGRAGGMMEASQCPSNDERWDEWGNWNTAYNNAIDTDQDYADLPPGTFQDAFHIGQALERRLNVLLTAAQPATDPANVAKGGIAELRTWAGATIVHAWPQGATGAWQSLAVRVSGMSYADDFGFAVTGAPLTATQQQALANSFGFVYGPPWMAECAAGVRADCPANFFAANVVTGNQSSGPTGAVTAQDVTPSVAATGVLDDSFELTMPLSAFPTAPPVLNPNTAIAPGESHLYMVLLHDATSTVGHGRVLGTLPVRGHWVEAFFGGKVTWIPIPGVTGFVDAPMQRELVHDALDLGRWVGARPPSLGGLSAAQSAGYCVDGVPRDLFVPLDNELVAGTQTYEDSWQAYLSLAQTAAQTADSLGKELIANDLQISQNQQAAEEKLADLCGDFGAFNGAHVANDGKITADPADPTTAACIGDGATGSDVTDVVFLGKLPTGITSTTDPARTSEIKKAINCPGSGGSGAMPQTASALCAKATLTAAALNIGVIDGGPPSDAGPLSAACNDLATQVAPSLRAKTGFTAQGYLSDLQDPSQTPSAMKTMASLLKMVVDVHDNWQVQYANEKIMDSQDIAFWPACINSGCAKGGPADSVGLSPPLTTYTMAPLWSQAFRNCPSGGAGSAPLGTCGDGDAATELNMLKWRVTQAMWMLAASSGVLPAGMFYQPIPVRIEDSNLDFPIGGNGYGKVPYVSFEDGVSNYYTGRLRSAPCPDPSIANCWTLDPAASHSTPGDIAVMGTLYDIDPRFGQLASSGEVPSWYRDMYSPSSSLYSETKHALVANATAIFDPCSATILGSPSPLGASCGSTSPDAGVNTPTAVSLTALVGMGGQLDGVTCQSPAGDGLPYDANAPAPYWWQYVANVKLGLAPQFAFPSFPVSFAGGSHVMQPELVTSLSGPVNTAACSQRNYVGCLTSPTLNIGFDYEADSWVSYPNPWYPGTSPFMYSPTQWPVSQRAASFAGYGAAPPGRCGALTLLLGTSALACTPSPSATALAGDLGTPPAVTKLSDVPLLEGWLASASAKIQASTGSFYLQEIPTQVVDDFKNGTIGSGHIGGTKGQAILTMEQQIQQFPSSWTSISSDLAQIASAITIANGAVVAANLTEQTADGSLALQAIQTQGNMTLAVDNFLVTLANAAASAVSNYGASLAVIPAAALTLADSLAIGNQELAQIQQMENTASQADQNQVGQALAQLMATTGPLWADVQKQIDSLRGYVAQIDATGQTVLQAEGQAAYQLAIGTGADFVQIAGQEVPIPVDTVLRRQASATLQRYQAALTNAKALAYMARRAIEQRIGVPLDALTQQVGPVEAPASWADNICSLQGVNYAQLSTATPSADGGGVAPAVDQAAISAFADAWVGDYVAKLQNFVTYYNVQYPSHQGQDTAILSLRYDLLPPSAECAVAAPNVLTNSGDLTQLGGASWELTPCSANAAKCLSVVGGYSLPSPSGPWGAQSGATASFPSLDGGFSQLSPPATTGVTWLVDIAQTAAPPDDAGADDAGAPPPSPPSPVPNNRVLQQVRLEPGTYVLSWWDQARDADGNIVWAGGAAADGGGGPVPSYLAEVFDPSWHAVAVYDQPPYTPPQIGGSAAPSLWSPRHALSFTVKNAGTYAVGFSASPVAGTLGSVAIADVQLEQAADQQPTTYVATTATTLVEGVDCPMSDADFRAAFTHACDDTGKCHYDLAVPFLIDTSALDGSPLDAKLANGNYNYRQVTTALNLVGTAVHDCTNDPTPNCYGSGYIKYSLQHDAQNAGIVGYDGSSRVFDFGVASISGGKALAAERYITMPVSSTDQQLLSQPGIQHADLGGRPLDGRYYLRIWDSPDLSWSALQDVQLIVDYEYWAQIQATSNQGRHPGRLQRARTKPTSKIALQAH